MNKIIINDDDVIVDIDNNIEIELKTETNFLQVRPLFIKVKKNAELKIEYNSTKMIKFDIFVNVLPNVNVDIFEIKYSGEYKLQYRYYLEENSKVSIFKFNNTSSINEMCIVNLNGENAKYLHNLRTISKNKEKYDLMIYHNEFKTESLIDNIGVNIENGEIIFNVSGFVPNNIKKCVLNQTNRIINLTNKKCVINPNFFIDEEDVVANHSALIGKFNKEQLFYLMSRGLTKNQAENLLVKGLLLKNMDSYKSEIEQTINNYWR